MQYVEAKFPDEPGTVEVQLTMRDTVLQNNDATRDWPIDEIGDLALSAIPSLRGAACSAATGRSAGVNQRG
jgi:hypothetical protein